METRRCLECNEEIIGRADKKFCDDQCRNSYNNKLNAEDVKIVKTINAILRKNRKILISFNPEGKKKIKKEKLLLKGYDLKYHTHTYTTKENAVYVFCYEYGLLALDSEWYLLVKND